MTTNRFRKPLHIALPDSTLLSGSSPYQHSPLQDEYDMHGSLNLGAESITPSPLPSPPMSRENSWLKTGDPFAIQLHQSTISSSSPYSVPPAAPARTANKQRLPASAAPSIVPGGRPMKGKRESVWDRDCAICFESAIHPHRTLCCGTLFCLEHISDWMERDTHCPTCRVEMVPSARPKNDKSDELLSSSEDLSTQETEVPHYDGAWARILRRRSSSNAATSRSTVTIETIMESEDALLLMRLALLLMMGLVYWVLLA